MKSCATLIWRGGARSSYSSIRAAVEWLAAVLFVLLLAGCSSTASIDRSAVRTSGSADDAFVFPPAGGPSIVGVIQGKRSGGIYQEILLGTHAATPGQNRIQVTVYENNAPLVNPYPRIAAEMRAALPGVRMVRSPYYVQNRYGPFGYAFGRSGTRDLCLFGWQSIRTRATPMTRQGGIDIRVRICETGATEQKLLSVMYGYTIDVFITSQRWNPYGSPLPPSAELGRAGANIYPAGPDQFATVTTAVPPAPVARRAQAITAAETPAVEPPTIQPKPIGPPVPPPPAAVSGESPAPAAQAPLVPLPPAED